jgi:tetratricopeptide (TPR) repeat protein
MGLIYNQLKQYNKAIECYEKAMKDNQYIPLPNLWNEMTKAYNKIGHFDKTPDCLQKRNSLKSSYS